jgi:hypothetical protein
MSLTDQHGTTSYAWFPPGTPTDPSNVLPARVYIALCRLVRVAPLSPWVEYQDRPSALAAALVAVEVGECHTPPGR